MTVVLAVDQPDMTDWLSPAQRAFLRRAGLTMRAVRGTYRSMLEDMLAQAYPRDQFHVEVRRRPMGAPVVWGRSRPYSPRVEMELTEALRVTLELAEIAWKSAVRHVTVRFAVAAASARR